MTHVTADVNSAFALYSSEESAEKAVDKLLENGFLGTNIFVLLPKNEGTRQFARKRQTQVPAGVDDPITADLPLDGKTGFLDMGDAPKMGALPVALEQMGVPADWSSERLLKGNPLISVKCNTWEEFFRAIGILQFTHASDVSWSLSPENYRNAGT